MTSITNFYTQHCGIGSDMKLCQTSCNRAAVVGTSDDIRKPQLPMIKEFSFTKNMPLSCGQLSAPSSFKKKVRWQLQPTMLPQSASLSAQMARDFEPNFNQYASCGVTSKTIFSPFASKQPDS